ncbi:MAG: RIO1 family regulatory kinase/ATPase [Thermodesulfobacteriota bacterium]|nr:RIO1 family regulatory kinase/ATPase [Thermodesulfobacteriota bacterium]
MIIKKIQTGKWGNCNLYLHSYNNNLYVEKTFENHHPLIKNTLGRFLIEREYKILKKLHPCNGTCDNVVRINSFSLRYRYIKGQKLSSFSRQGRTLDEKFFKKLENAVKEIHACGIVHLDLRNGSNIIVSEQKNPLIIDFNSSLNLNLIPGTTLKTLLKNIDLSGVYKYWAKINPGTLKKEKKKLLIQSNRKRRLWFLRGYMLESHVKKKKT